MTETPVLTFYNTLTRQKERFTPIDPANVRMYVCGPTVYDYAHIGNARPAIVFDVLFRLLRHVYGADHVTYVRNITDVDDKINARALRDYSDEIDAGRMSLNAAIRQVTEKTLAQYLEDTAALGCLEPTVQPRATEHIEGMVAMIRTLIYGGHAYVAAGSEGREVLFDVASMPAYGGLSKRNLDEQQAGARIAVEAHKKNPADFVLWKESAANEPGWDGKFPSAEGDLTIHGRPGWHIECSVMSEHHLGPVFDIHGGGLDLIFPHHENEIAQSCCAHGNDRMANYWMHNGFLQVEGKKMSKSEGNFFTIHELMATENFGGRKWPGEVLRLAMLMTHYREPIDFSQRRLEEAEAVMARLWRRAGETVDSGDLGPVIESLSDDLNTVDAFRAMNALSGAPLRAALSLFGLPETAPTGDIDMDAVQTRIDERLAFIRDKNWAEADRIRDELLSEGIQLKDGKDSETGERITTWEVRR
ncbi:cysteine--tRNA ligase [Oricola indica]|jgi:cysteinyl-tRNA synthetase|uniref:cysteine--tRNA ligase n=1 Tax=Oricola indica TaxID=2872591 RepID=UPI001CBF14E4|nr:cysteine--tRNA ligase [Oricola indica]